MAASVGRASTSLTELLALPMFSEYDSAGMVTARVMAVVTAAAASPTMLLLLTRE